jgi:hypothetical protein
MHENASHGIGALYKEIRNPEGIRKTSLMLAIDTIHLLEDYEKYRKLMKKKQVCSLELRRVVSDVKDRMRELDFHFPNVRALESREAEVGMKSELLDIEEKEDLMDRQVQRRDAGELASLHSEAERIRSRLATLNTLDLS